MLSFFNRCVAQGDRRASAARGAIAGVITAQAIGGVFHQVMVMGGFFALLVIHFGGSRTAVGAVFAMQFLSQLVQLAVAPRMEHVNKRVAMLRWFTISATIACCLLFAFPIRNAFGATAAVVYMIGIFMVERVALNVAATFWLPMLAITIPRRFRGRFFARMRGTFQAVSFVAVVVVGWYMGREPDTYRFAVVLSCLLVCYVMRTVLLWRTPFVEADDDGSSSRRVGSMLAPLRDHAFRPFLVFWLCLITGTCLVGPFAVPFLKLDLGFPSSVTVHASSGLLLGSVVTILAWGKIADKWGNRIVFLVTTVLMALAFTILALTPSYETSPKVAMVMAGLAFVIRGIGAAGLGIAQTVRLMHVAPEEQRGTYMALFIAANGIVAGTVTILSGMALDNLPEAILIMGHDVTPTRVFLPLASLLILSTIFLVVRLEPIHEPPLRDVLNGMSEVLPRPLAFPLRIVGRK